MLKVQTDGKKCEAAIGRVYPDQHLSVPLSCYSAGSICHELIHVLGFIHSHQRTDRDEYLKLNISASSTPTWSSDFSNMQYRKYANQILLVPYDYGSVMQYSDEDDEYNPNNPEYHRTMGSNIVSFYDYLMINLHYECYCSDDFQIDCKHYGYPNPSNCHECNCPLGFGGLDCSERPEPGETLTATEEWQNTKVSLDAGYTNIGNDTKFQQIDYVYQYLWITAPINKTIEVNLKELSGVKCDYGCKEGGIEVKTHPDPRMTSPRACCSDEKQIYKSQNNPTIVMFYNLKGLNEYKLSYRFID
ncbi:unnamed protein product [Caenorhabditis brenneri]